MINVYDIILNLLDGNRIYDFFEWKSNDNIEHIKKIPMVKVSSSFLKDIAQNSINIDINFLKEIYIKTEIYNDDSTTVIDYACLFTDSNKVIAVEFDKEGKSLFKSNLLIEEEEEILELSNEIKLQSIKYRIIKKYNYIKFLTREEEYRINYLLKEINYAYKKGLSEKINYLYEEIFPSDNKSLDDKYNILVNDIKENYSKNHNKIFKILKLTHSKKKTTSN